MDTEIQDVTDVKKEGSEEPSAEDTKTVEPGTPGQEPTGEEEPEKKEPAEETPPAPKKESRRNRKIRDLIRDNRKALDENIRLTEQNRKLKEDQTGPAPKPEDFENDGDYQRAESEFTDKKHRQTVKAAINEGRIEDSEEEIRNTESGLIDAFNEEKESLSPERPEDFKDKIASLKTRRIHSSVADYVYESEVGPDLAYELAKKPGILDEMVYMTTSEANRKIVHLETEVINKLKTRKVSRASDPINPIGETGGKITKGKTIFSKFNNDDDWVRQREADLKIKREAQLSQ